jgi:hypothetical protein
LATRPSGPTADVPAEDSDLCFPRDLNELFRYEKNGRTRTYRLRAVGAASELWVVAGGGGQEPKSRRLMTLTDPGDAEPLFESIEQELRAGGWSRA